MGRRRKSRKDLPERVYSKHGSYFFVDRKNKWHNLGKDFHQALIRYAEINSSAYVVTRLGHVMDRFIKEELPKLAIRTRKDRFREIDNLRKVFGAMRPDDITSQQIYKYMDLRNAPVRANRERSTLSRLFQCAIRWGIATQNPCRDVRPNKETPRDRYVEDWEFWAVHDIAPLPVQLAMQIALATGAAQGIILNLTHRDCKEDGLYIPMRKGGKPVILEWTPELRALVERCKSIRTTISSVYLICNRHGQRYTPHGFKAMWQRVMRRAMGQPTYNGQQDVPSPVIEERFTFHDLRAKSASDHETGEHLGHQSNAMLKRV
ncbi:MAG: hypothetical protein AMS22_11385, partial [Thiotrichales bacterium SG8_50]